jgi:hypothetical protein
VTPAGQTHGFHDGQIIDISGASQSQYNGRFLIRLSSTTGCTINQTNEKNRKFWYVISNQSATTPATGTITAQTPPTDYSRGGNWRGCVEARPSPFEEDSAEATHEAAPWVRYYWPSTRGVRFYNTSKAVFSLHSLPGSSPTSFTGTRYGDNDWGSTGYNGQTGMNPAVTDHIGSDYFAYGPNFGCGTPILPLQPDKDAVLTAINNMDAWGRSGTMANLGLAWGWRVLSPAWQGRWTGTPAGVPVPYTETLVSKVVVLLTDGKNEWVDYPWVLPGCSGLNNCVGNNGHPNDADLTAYGRLSERRFGPGVNTIAEATAELDDRMLNLCNAMKDQGIIIYTIVLEQGNQDLYRDCASAPANAYAFFAPTTNELAGIFQQIADQLANLRLAR